MIEPEADQFDLKMMKGCDDHQDVLDDGFPIA